MKERAILSGGDIRMLLDIAHRQPGSINDYYYFEAGAIDSKELFAQRMVNNGSFAIISNRQLGDYEYMTITYAWLLALI